MMKVLIAIFSIIFTIIISHAQNMQTNIDTLSIQLNWMQEDLKTTQFQNGEELKIAHTLTEWNELNLKNRSAVYIFDNKSEELTYLYNWYALKDSRGLAPKGYHIPSTQEFLSARILFSSTIINNVGITNFKTNSEPYIMDEGFFNEPFLQNYWTRVDGFNDISEWPAIEINQNNKSVSEIPFNKKSGLSVRCIENLQDKLRDSTFSYKTIIPSAYNELTNELIKQLKSGSDFNNGSYKIIGTIQFSNAGINTSPSLKLLNDTHSIPNSFFQLEKTIKNFKLYPYYNRIPISAQSEISLSIVINEIKNKKDLSVISHAFPELNGMTIMGLIAKTSNKSTSIQVNTETTRTKFNQLSLMRVKAVNPAFSLLSIMGQGIKVMNRYYDITNQFQNKFVYKYSRFAIKAVPTFLAIAVLSKGISYAFYSSYRKDLTNEAIDWKYNIANVSQKTFVVSSAIYSVLALTDFSVALTIGIQNKQRSHQINKLIKTNYPGGFIIK